MNDDKWTSRCVVVGVAIVLALAMFFYGCRGILGARQFAVKITRVTNQTELVGELVNSKFIWDPDHLSHDYKIISQGINRAAFVDHRTGSEQTNLDVDQRITITSSDKIKFELEVLLDYKIDPLKSIQLIANYPVEDDEKFETGYLLNWLRQALSEASVTYSGDQIYEKKEEFRQSAEEILKTNLDSLGITVVDLIFKSDPIPADPNIVESYQQITKTKLAEQNAAAQVAVQEKQNTLIKNQALALEEGAGRLKGIDPALLRALNDRYNAETRRQLAEKGINPFPAFVVPGAS